MAVPAEVVLGEEEDDVPVVYVYAEAEEEAS